MAEPITLHDVGFRTAGTLGDGRPVDWYVQQQISTGEWKEETIPADVLGLSRPLTVVRAPRKTGLISYSWHGDRDTFCPPRWWDLAIGSGACGLGCRVCFLLLTHRVRRDPWRHLLYNNVGAFVRAAEKWLQAPERRRHDTLGVGIDRSDSLLYEGVTEQVRLLAPLFGSSKHNPRGNKLILLTKTANTRYLNDIAVADRANIVVTFSLNPQSVADCWEGKWPDTQERIPPTIAERLAAARYAQELGFEVRARIDPILTPPGWQDAYAAFIEEVRAQKLAFTYITLGSYREKNQQLGAWAQRWGLLPMDWELDDTGLVKTGTHWHLPDAQRIAIYSTVRDLIGATLSEARVSLCKETNLVRKEVGLCNAHCNCLP